ncbi:MAG: hypothetical protein HYU36_13705 [Planctomycetes bacterium]|nr:hypothetical protein [Planctomycetota bacterium]
MRNHLSRAVSCLFLLSAGTLAADPQPIFYVPFEGSPDAVVARGNPKPFQAKIEKYEDGPVGKAALSVRRYNGIRWDGRGNIDLDRGTLAFFYKPLYEPGAAEWDPLAGVSSDLEGYWAGVIQFINKVNVNKQTSFALHFFDIGRYSPVLELKPTYERWKKDEWHHLAAVWDRHEGVTVYEDGQRVVSNWGRGRWDWSACPRILVFGDWAYSTAPFGVDEAYCFAECLSDAQVAQLARGEKPTGDPIPIASDVQRLEAELARRGWSAADLAELPQVLSGKTLSWTFARVTQAIDAHRAVAQPFEGLRDTCWPLQKYGASTKGQRVEFHLAPGQRFDRVRLFAQRPFSGRLMEVLPGVGANKLFEISTKRPLWRGSFATERSDLRLLLERDWGQVGQIDFYRVEPVRALPKRRRAFSTARLARLPATLAGVSALGETPTRFDNAVLATEAKTPEWEVKSPAFGGFQLLTNTLEEALPLEGVVLKLVVDSLYQPTAVRVLVKEPVMPQRDWLDAEAVLVPRGKGPQAFTLHLQGRPVISFPKVTQLVGRDGKNQLEDPGREVAVLVTASEPVTWRMGDGGTSLSLCLAEDGGRVLPAAVEDQTEFAREAYAETNEGHIWDVLGYQGWGRLFYPLKWLMLFAPDARPTMELAARVSWRAEDLPFAAPANTTGAPDWAFWQMQSLAANRRIIHWIIDHRQAETGEFGGVWGDDTDMTEYWSDYALAFDDDRKITRALQKFWGGLYRDALVEGVSRTIRDALHSYEEGMGAICHQLLVDYGDPIAVEHVMRASSHYFPKWMKVNEDGSYTFRSNYLGYSGVYTEGGFGQDVGVNYLMLYPAAYLTWYNRHPEATKVIRLWKRSPEVWGLVGDAYLRLRYPDDAERRAEYLKRIDERGDPRNNPEALNALLDEVGTIKPEWADKFVQGAKGNPWRFFAGNLPEYAGYSDRMTEYFWLAYRASGDLSYLVQSYRQACRFINNQEWLYTVAQPSTDRIPLPSPSLTRARLGAMAVTRGASGCFWPRHALSYTRGAMDVAALVSESTESGFTARFFCFAETEHRLGLRVWRLLPGRYRVSLHRDANADGAAEDALLQREMELDRGAALDLDLPPRQGSLLKVEAIETRPMEYDLPDAAIGLADVVLEYGDHLHATVHNLGSKPVENLAVRVSDGHTGAVIGERVVRRIEPPLDLLPKTEMVEITNANAITKRSILIELDPERKHPDLNRYNNRVEFRY